MFDTVFEEIKFIVFGEASSWEFYNMMESFFLEKKYEDNEGDSIM